MFTLVLLASLAGAWLWLHSPDPQHEAVQAARDFARALPKNPKQAFELTSKQDPWLGTTLQDFLRRTKHPPACLNNKILYTHPPQSRGNRLRRMLTGKTPNMPLVHLEFVCSIPFGLTLHLGNDGHYKIFTYGAHAG